MKAYVTKPAEYFPGIDLYVVIGEERARKVARKLGLYLDDTRHEARTVHKVGEDFALVCFLGSVFEDTDDLGRSALIAHESVHCADAWCESLGEDDPGEEEFAYMVQCCFITISQGVEEERRRISGHGGK